MISCHIHGVTSIDVGASHILPSSTYARRLKITLEGKTTVELVLFAARHDLDLLRIHEWDDEFPSTGSEIQVLSRGGAVRTP